MELTITTPKDIVLVSDGQERVVRTTAATAGDLLAEQGIALSEIDRTSLYLSQGLLNRMRLQVYRVAVTETQGAAPIPHERVETPDPNAFVGDETVAVPGVDGEQVTTFRITLTDGVETARETLEHHRDRAPWPSRSPSAPSRSRPWRPRPTASTGPLWRGASRRTTPAR